MVQGHSRIGWPFIRRSAKTRSREKTEDFNRKFEEQYEAKQEVVEEAFRPDPAFVTFCTLVTIHCHYGEQLALSPEIHWTTRRDWLPVAHFGVHNNSQKRVFTAAGWL
jgi:hypothetical protein